MDPPTSTGPTVGGSARMSCTSCSPRSEMGSTSGTTLNRAAPSTR